MGVKEFWKNRTYFQKGFIIGILLYFWILIFASITSSLMIGGEFGGVIAFVIFPLIFGLLFGFIGFLIGLIREGLWREFFKPNKKKIQINLLLFGMLAFLAFLAYILYPTSEIVVFFPIYLAMIIFYNLSAPFLIFLILFTYVFGCYISRSGKLLKGVIFYLLSFMLISVPLMFAIWAYDEALVNRDCNTDYDCYDTCEKGAVSKQSRHLSDPFQTCNLTLVVCENNMWCETYYEYEVSESYCEEREGLVKSICYHDLAKSLDDLSFCDKIENESLKEKCQNIETSEKICEKLKEKRLIANCYYEFAKYSNAHNVCDKIRDEEIKVDCKIKHDILSEEDCEKMKENSYGYYELAKNLRNPSLCNRTEDDCFKEGCLARFIKTTEPLELTQEELEKAKAIGLTEEEAKTAKSLDLTPEEFNKTYTKAYEAFIGGSPAFEGYERFETQRTIGYSRISFEEAKRSPIFEGLGIKPCSKIILVEYAQRLPTPSMIVLIKNGEVKVVEENLQPAPY